MFADNTLPADFLDGDDPFADTMTVEDGQSTDGNYDDLLDGIDIEREAPEAGKPAADGDKPGEEKPSGDTAPADGSTDTGSWEPAPAPIPDWEKVNDQYKLGAKTEAEFRDIATIRRYAQDQMENDPDAKQLFQLADPASPAKHRLTRYVAERVKEPFESADDPEVIARAAGAMTDYLDDEDNLTENGKRLDTYLQKKFATEFNLKAAAWEDGGKKLLESNRQFQQALQTTLADVAGLSPEQQREAYSLVRRKYLDNIVDGLDEKGKELPPEETARQQAEAIVWTNPKTRKILLQQIADESKKSGESDLLKKLLA